VDGRSAFLNEPAQHDHIDYFQSFAKYRERGLPTSLPAEEEAAIKQDAHLVKLENEAHRLRTENASSKEVMPAKNEARAYRARTLKKRLTPYKLEWVRKRRD
jgi:hypothetical protein